MSLTPKYPEVLLDLADCIRRILVDGVGLSRNEADDAAATIAREFSDLYAGQQIYVPIGYALKLSERDEELYQKHLRGTHKDDLIREYTISNATFYQIVRRVRAIHVARTQLGLFEDSPSASSPPPGKD